MTMKLYFLSITSPCFVGEAEIVGKGQNQGEVEGLQTASAENINL